jgi:hypothetical protein
VAPCHGCFAYSSRQKFKVSRLGHQTGITASGRSMSVFLVNARRVMLTRLARRVHYVRAEECRPLGVALSDRLGIPPRAINGVVLCGSILEPVRVSERVIEPCGGILQAQQPMERMRTREAASGSRVPTIGRCRQVVRDFSGDHLPPAGGGQAATASSRRGQADLAFSRRAGAATKAAPDRVIGGRRLATPPLLCARRGGDMPDQPGRSPIVACWLLRGQR